MEELMQKELLSKLLRNNASISTEYFTRHEVYSSQIEINKRFPEYVWKITSQNTGKTINTSLVNSYTRLLNGISKLIEGINNLFTIKCKYFTENRKLLTELEITLEEKCSGNTWTFIYYKIKSEESAELLLIQAKKFIVDELTKLKESIL
jgi:hypothetical protein